MRAKIRHGLVVAALFGGTVPAVAAWDNGWKAGLDADHVTMMETALQRGEAKAMSCFVGPGAENGAVSLVVTFNGATGRISDAVVGEAYAASPIAACLKRAYIGEIILPFDGPARKVMDMFTPP